MPRPLHGREYRHLRELLIEARKKARLTQEEVSRRLNRHQSFVSKYERGERRIDLIDFLVIAKALNLDASKVVRHLQRLVDSGK